MLKKVSIIVPVYNMENEIERSLRSILGQTYNNVEIILVNDGSTDNTLSKCESLVKRYSHVSVYTIKNQGSGPARNYGIRVAKGDYVYFPDADDILEQDAIETLVHTMESEKCDLIVFGYKSVTREGKLLSEKRYNKNILSGKHVRENYERYIDMNFEFGIQGAPWNKFFNLRTIKDNNIEYPPLRRHQDEVFISRYVNYSKKVCFISNVFYVYFRNDLRSEWNKYPTNYIEVIRELREYQIGIIPKWNLNNTKIANIINSNYITGFIKALELSFNKKNKLSNIERYIWIKDEVSKGEFLSLIKDHKLARMPYQNKIIDFINRKNYKKLYITLYLKVLISLRFNWLELLVKKTLQRITNNK